MVDELEGQQSAGFDLDKVLGIVRRRHWHFLIPLFFGWLMVWAASWLLPPRYKSGTLILVEQPTMPRDYVKPNVNDDLQDRLQSITQQILSQTRLLQIIDALNLYPEERRNHSPDELVERMRKDIDIQLLKSDRNELASFNVYFSSGNPATAQQVTSELTKLFIKENLELRQQQSEDTTKFLEGQLEDARKILVTQEQKVREFKDRHSGELPTQLGTNLQILSGLQNQLQTQEDALNAAKQQTVYLQSLLTQYRALLGSPKTTDGTSVGLPALDQELEKLKSQLADLSAHYTERHPDVRKLREQIAKTEKMRQQIVADIQANSSKSPPSNDAGTTNQTESDVRDVSPMVQVEGQLRANQIEVTNREHAIAALEAKVNQYEGRLSQEPLIEQQFTDLTRGYDQSKAHYDELLKKKDESAMATSMELRQQGQHFRTLDPPSLPLKPDFPNHLKFCGIGIAIGLALGVSIAAGTEFLDDRVHDQKDLKELISFPVLSEIPNITNAAEERKERKAILLSWAAASLVFVSILASVALSYLRG